MTEMTSVPVGTTGRACPVCGTPLVTERGAAPWCERCAWGIDVYDPPAGMSWWRRRIGAATHRIAYRLTMNQFRKLARDGSPFAQSRTVVVETLRPARRWGLVRVAVIVFSIVLYAFMALLAYLGVRLVLFEFPKPTIVPGLLLIAIAITLLPTFPRLPRHADVLSRDQAPTLFALVDRVAAGVDTKPPRSISVDSRWNASTIALGLRRRRHVAIGLSLFGALNPQQRVAVLAHEMGHFRNGDIRRGLLTQPAMTSLGRLSALFGVRRVVRYRLAGPTSVSALVEPVVQLIMSTISSVFYLAHLGVLAVMLRDSQRREYLADQRSAQLAGTAATAQVLDLLSSDAASVVASRARAQQLQPAWREAAAGLIGPDRVAKVRRLRQLSTRTDVSLWTTHPPSGLRAWLVEAEAWQSGSLVLSEAQSSQIDAELAGYYQRARRDLAQSGV